VVEIIRRQVLVVFAFAEVGEDARDLVL
jgi:hypothetical protein